MKTTSMKIVCLKIFIIKYKRRMKGIIRKEIKPSKIDEESS